MNVRPVVKILMVALVLISVLYSTQLDAQTSLQMSRRIFLPIVMSSENTLPTPTSPSASPGVTLTTTSQPSETPTTSATSTSTTTSTATNTATTTSTATNMATTTNTATNTATTTSTATNTATTTSTATNTATTTSTATNMATTTNTATTTSTATNTATNTPTRTAITPTTTPSGPDFTKLDTGILGFADSSTHQIVRTSNGRVYFFVQTIYLNYIRAYRSNSTATATGFTEQDASNRPNESSAIWAVDSAIDANGIVHILANTQNGPVVYYTFNTNTNTWGRRTQVASSEWLNDGGIQQGSTSISLVLDSSGVAHVVYIKKVNNFRRVYYNNNQGGSWSQELLLDNQPDKHNFHATLAFGADGSLYAAWFTNLVNQPGSIFVRIRKNGVWQATTTEVATGAWGAGYYSLDQGPSLIVTPNGAVHITYINGYEPVPGSPSNYEYGRVKHYYSSNAGTSWINDDPPTRYSHSPSLATDPNGNLYIFGHREQWKVERCADMYVVAKPAGGSWGSWRILDQGCLDSSVSNKWSQYNWHNPEVLDFLYWTEHGPAPENQSDYNRLFYGEIRGGVSAINKLLVAPAP